MVQSISNVLDDYSLKSHGILCKAGYMTHAGWKASQSAAWRTFPQEVQKLFCDCVWSHHIDVKDLQVGVGRPAFIDGIGDDVYQTKGS